MNPCRQAEPAEYLRVRWHLILDGFYPPVWAEQLFLQRCWCPDKSWNPQVKLARKLSDSRWHLDSAQNICGGLQS
jgi:hypothetical protein